MITSMTGYGHGVHIENDIEATVEVKSVNNRYLDTSIKTPKSLSLFEPNIREIIGQYAKRGRVNVWISLKSNDNEYQNLALNQELVDAYVRLSREIADRHQLEAALDLSQLLTLPDVITMENEDESDEKLWAVAQKALHQALKEMNGMRNREGLEIKIDFEKRIKALDTAIKKIEAIAADGPEAELEKLRERVKKLIGDKDIDEGRLELELAVISDRIDITEECTRFHSHNTVFGEMLESNQSEGRKLNFLLQEMNREANTMAAKAYTTDISHRVVEIKEEIEKIREQVQNIE